MADDIFKTDETTEEVKPEGNPLVGEGKKYTTNEEQVKGHIEGDLFINQLTTENDELRGELDKRLNAEDVLSDIKRERVELEKTTLSARENTTPVVDEEVLSKLISNTVDKRDADKVASSNINIVDAKMKEIFGADKAHEVLQDKARTMNLSVDSLAKIASESPLAFFNTLGISQDQKPVTTPSATVGTTNTEAVEDLMAGKNAESGTMGYYEDMRKANPRKFFTPEIQNQLFKSRKEKGQEGFYK